MDDESECFVTAQISTKKKLVEPKPLASKMAAVKRVGGEKMAKSDFWLSIYSVVAAQFEREGIGSEDKKLKERGGSLQSLPFQIGPLTGQTKMTRSPRVYHAINTRWLTQNGAKMT